MIDFNKISMINIGKLYDFLQRNEQMSKRLVRQLWKSIFVLGASYILASSLTSLMMVMFFNPVSIFPPRVKVTSSAAVKVEVPQSINYRTLRKVVTGRNIFNSTGELPDESASGGAGEGTNASSAFNRDAACNKTALNIELLGLIYMQHDPATSIATIQEKGINYADIYHPGDSIIGADRAVVFDITQHQVIINNNGVKECLDLEDIDKAVAKKFSSATAAAALAAGGSLTGGKEGGDANAAVDYHHFTLEPDFVEKAVGPGFGKILQAGRLVPFNKDNQMIGFKLINVEQGSIFTKIGLAAGDVITKVNDISMAQPDQGFALYQALQDSREIRVEYLKGGAQPTTLTIDIK